MAQPLITLTTDFGSSDHFVGTMKGVILGICPDARIVDICHDTPPFDVVAGAFLIAQAWPYFPKKTVHVVVVDPGVGSARRPILLEAGGHRFVAPDNGVLSMIEAPRRACREITAAKYMLKAVSKTFHGRDVFAPAAAHLAKGAAPKSFGPLVEDALRLNIQKPRPLARRIWSGAILKIDRFGNLITNFRLAEFPDLANGRPFELAVGFEKVIRIAATYADAPPGELVWLEGSSGYLEVSLNQDSAARRTGCAAGAPVELTFY